MTTNGHALYEIEREEHRIVPIEEFEFAAFPVPVRFSKQLPMESPRIRQRLGHSWRKFWSATESCRHLNPGIKRA